MSQIKIPLKRLFCFGLGYSGNALSDFLNHDHRSWEVTGTTLKTCTNLDKHSSTVIRFPFWPEEKVQLTENAVDHLRSATHLLSTVPPSLVINQDMVIDQVKLAFKFVRPERLEWIGYISTTSIYGDWNGEWVDESSSLRATDKKSQARIVAEEQWLQFGQEMGIPAHIFRLGGIYGPGRRKGELTKRQKERRQTRFTARCHILDVCQVIKASMDQPLGGVYNVVDDNPASRIEVENYARQLMGLELMEESSTFQVGKRKGEKRVKNTKIKEELGVKLIYPDYKEGLNSIHRQLMFLDH